MNLSPVSNPAALCLGVPILALFVFLGYVAFAFVKDQADAHQQREKTEALLAPLGIDRMGQAEFHRFAADLLRKQGYIVRTPHSGRDEAAFDAALMLTATKDGASYAVCAICSNKPISPGVIAYANACRARHGCDQAMVITNTFFRADARKLAQATGCALVDREEIVSWIAQGDHHLLATG